MKTKNIITLIICLAIPQIAGGIGALATTPNIDSWYASIIKPSFNPPNWIFGPVWTFLFLLMGIALYFVWTSKQNKARTIGLRVFGIQLILNIVWSYLFFAMHRPDLAFLEIIILLLAIIANMIAFYSIKKTSAYLLAPYLAWVIFASALNFAIWQLN